MILIMVMVTNRWWSPEAGGVEGSYLTSQSSSLTWMTIIIWSSDHPIIWSSDYRIIWASGFPGWKSTRLTDLTINIWSEGQEVSLKQEIQEKCHSTVERRKIPELKRVCRCSQVRGRKKCDLNSLWHLAILTRVCFWVYFLDGFFSVFSECIFNWIFKLFFFKCIFCECEREKVRPQLFVALGEID